MENLEILKNDTFGEINLLKIDGSEYFQANQCALILGYSNPYAAIKKYTKYFFKHKVLTAGGNQEVIFTSCAS